MELRIKITALAVVFGLFGLGLHAQKTITGSVRDAGTDDPLIGARVLVKGTDKGANTDLEGRFSIEVETVPVTLIIDYLGYDKQEVEHPGGNLDIAIEGGLGLDDVVIVGSRFVPRTVITSPVPVDNIRMDDLLNTGQQTVDKMLHYSVPSFNSTQQTVSDATAHFDPADLRGLGPSRTLVLVNGKRKNPSALVYINDTPGKGEVGVDMKSIPAAAIERIEVLRDGASTQYGSDAIAGVINIVLKDDYEYTEANVFSGITTEGDGFNLGYNVNTGFKIGEGGFANVSASYSEQKETNRANSPGQDDLFGVPSSDPFISANPDLGMRIGTPNMTIADVFYNTEIPVSETSSFYSFGGLTYRKGTSYALYRTPYWVPDPNNIFHAPGTTYEGFQPTFETDIFDNTLAFGVKGEKRGWKYDISNITGGNKVDYTIGNTLNPAMGANSPTIFRAGGYSFRNNVTNLDLARRFFDKLTVNFGTEFRTENFIARAGEEASYVDGGAQSFPGLQPQNEIDAVRYNVGVYADLGFDVTEDFFLGGAARLENYSDFGQTATWKVTGRYKFAEDKFTIRGSASTGFRAPSLHQIYLSNVQTLVSGGTISNQGTFNNESPVVRNLGVDRLKEENAFNFTAGVAARPVTGLYLSADFYNIAVDDRIVYSSSIASSDTSLLIGQILRDANITSLKFFTNAVNTVTSGVDFVANYKTDLGAGQLGFNLGLNFNSTRIEGQIATPEAISAAGVEIFDRKEQSRILTARPQDKQLLGISYEIGGFRAVLNNTRFGEVTWQHATDETKDQTFAAKIVTDLNLHYQFNPTLGLGVSVNNLLNVYPDKIDPKGDPVTDLGGRFLYPWEVNQFGFNGTTLSGNLNIRF